MSNEQALLNCPFGWGKTCRLYLDSLEIAGKSYNLDDLTSIYPTYRNVLGVPSARLELHFGSEHLVLRGIPDMEAARLLVSQLRPYCSDEPHSTHPRSRSTSARTVAKAQARAWERTSKLPAIPVSPEASALTPRAPRRLEHASLGQPLMFDEDEVFDASFDELPISKTVPSSEDEPRSAEVPFSSDPAFETPAPFYASADPWPLAPSQPVHAPRFQPPLRSVHLIPPGQRMQDTSSMPIAAVKSSVLPIIHVPVRLQPGECAHYSIGASLCSDRISGSDRAPYPPLDHGLLILTNRRIFYIGKRSQLILAYTHLWYVSLLHSAIALHIEQQFRRIIIEMEHPQEWASRIEQLSFIARRAQPRSELPTLLVAALPGLQSSALSAATLKRPAIKKPVARDQAAPASDTDTPLLPEQIASNIVEAQTISLSEESNQHCADAKTLEFPLSPESGEHTPQDPAQQPDLADMATQDFTRQPDLADTATPDLTQQPTLTTMTTQEIFLAAARSMGMGRGSEVTTSALYDSAAPFAWDDTIYEETETLHLHGKTDDLDEEDEEEVQTIPLRAQQATCASSAQGEPISDRLPDLEITLPRISRIRGTRQPAYAKERKLY